MTATSDAAPESPEKPQASTSSGSDYRRNIQYDEPTNFRTSDRKLEKKSSKLKFWRKYREGQKRYE
jgi:hypothetical protein